ncbi:MAG: hypothetical protein KHZ87_03025 [Clostridiales bacterium]|nr:hypothetical protein [Clostridiales bacterium]MBS5877229.1 hypothetical protein [Clostridiales bacterium]MDU0938931.1 CarD family transcriptional regulator [Clostridiales bacterium]MDU1041934.1 CarD family transcriptional regulator [Clostridiales bacterium]MDU3490678.1 CarD family transcriptional regulator [Clostridiales bacterium]
MFAVDDKVMYGIIGVCKVEAIDTPPITGVTGEYYFLQPVFDDRGLIYSPVENKVPMREIMSKDECDNLIERAKNCQDDEILSQKLSFNDYDNCIKSQDADLLLHLIRFLYSTKNARAKELRKMKSMDNRVLATARKLLYGEMAVAMDRSFEQISNEMDGFLSC